MVKNIASFILLVVICVSCGKHEYPSALVEADSLCYSNPKLALEKLAQIRKDLDTLKSASNLNGNLNCSKELEHYAS